MKKTVRDIYREFNSNDKIPELQEDCKCFSPEQMIWFAEEVVKLFTLSKTTNLICDAPKSFLPCNVRDNGKCKLLTYCDYQRKRIY